MSNLSKARTIIIVLCVTAAALAAGEYLKSRLPSGSSLEELRLAKKSDIVGPSPFEKADRAIGARLDGPYPFFDQDGKPFELSQWLDKPLVISYIFTECPMVCPTITQSLADFVKTGFKTLGTDFRIVTIGFDPASDKPAAMKIFGSKFTNDFSQWRFVTGTPEVVRRLAEDIGIAYEPDDEGSWRHTMGVTVVAPPGVVSGQILGMTLDVAELEEKISKAAAQGKDK